MGNIVGLDLNIDNNYLEKAVKQTVLMGISESLNSKNEIVSQIVNAVLTTKVDDKGRISSYERENKYSLLEYYVKSMLKDMIVEEIKAICEERKPELTDMIRKEMTKKATAKKFVDKFFDCMCSNLDSSWNTNITVDFEKKKEEY